MLKPLNEILSVHANCSHFYQFCCNVNDKSLSHDPLHSDNHTVSLNGTSIDK